MAKTNDEAKLYQEALNRWGVPSQIDLCIEEMAELTKALLKLRREKDHSTMGMRYLRVYQEIADVEIMLAQLRCCFDPAQIDQYKQAKLRNLAMILRGK